MHDSGPTSSMPVGVLDSPLDREPCAFLLADGVSDRPTGLASIRLVAWQIFRRSLLTGNDSGYFSLWTKFSI